MGKVLLESPFDPIRRQMNSVLLTIDLTKAVADEAIERKDCVVVAYHPIIFKGFKSLTLADSQQQSLLRLALEGISVYSPHTAVDAAPGGLGDWLADIVTGTLPGPEPETHTAGVENAQPALEKQEKYSPRPDSIREEGEEEGEAESVADKDATTESPKPKPRPTRPSMAPRASTYSKPTYPKPAELDKSDLSPSDIQHTRSVIHPLAKPPLNFKEAGMGRLVKFSEPQPLTHLIERIAHGVGSPKGFPVAIPQTRQVEDIMINSVGICAGSGHDVLKNVDADLLFTGELSHHDALKATEKGQCVVTLFHSNTERGFLGSVLKEKLTIILKEEWQKVREEVRGEINSDWELAAEWEDALSDEDVLVECSERDRDPFGIVILQSSPQVGHPLSGD